MKKDITRLLTIITMALMVALIVNPVNVQAKTVKAMKVSTGGYDMPRIKPVDKKAYLYEEKYTKPAYLNGQPAGWEDTYIDKYYGFNQIPSVPQIGLGKQYITFKDGFKGGITGTHYAVMFIPQETGTYQFTCTNRNKNKKVTKNFQDGEMQVHEMAQDENGNFACKQNSKYFSMKLVYNTKKVGTRISTCGDLDGIFWNSKKTPKYRYKLEKGKVYIMSFFSTSSFKRSTKVEIGVSKIK